MAIFRRISAVVLVIALIGLTVGGTTVSANPGPTNQNLLVMFSNKMVGDLSKPLTWTVEAWSLSGLPSYPTNPLALPARSTLVAVGLWTSSFLHGGYSYLFSDCLSWGCSFKGYHWNGMTPVGFPASGLSAMNLGSPVACSGVQSFGTLAVTEVYVTDSLGVQIDAASFMGVWYAPVSSTGIGSWTSVFGDSAWRVQGATEYAQSGLPLTKGAYIFAVQWADGCGGGIQGFTLTGNHVGAPASTAGSLLPTIGAFWQPVGAKFTIEASPKDGSRFVSWAGSGTGSFTGATNPVTITMNSAVTEMANFS
jgi:hypothetical protein